MNFWQYLILNPFDIQTESEWAFGGDVMSYVEGILITLIVLAGVVAAGFIVVGAYTIITAGGEPENIAKGYKTITNAIIGLVLAALAFVIVSFVIDFAQNPANPSSGGTSPGSGTEQGGSEGIGSGTNPGGETTDGLKCSVAGREYPLGYKICEGNHVEECKPSSLDPQKAIWHIVESCGTGRCEDGACVVGATSGTGKCLRSGQEYSVGDTICSGLAVVTCVPKESAPGGVDWDTLEVCDPGRCKDGACF